MIVIDEALISLTVATSGEEASVLKTRAAEFQLQDRAQEHFEPAFWNRGAAAPASFTGLVSLLTVWVKLELPMTRASRFSWVAVVANTMLQTAPNAEWQTERTSSTLALHSADRTDRAQDGREFRLEPRLILFGQIGPRLRFGTSR